MTVVRSVSEPALLGELVVEILLPPAVQVKLLLGKVRLKFSQLEVVINPLIKSPGAKQGDLLGDSRGDLGRVGGLDQLRVEELRLLGSPLHLLDLSSHLASVAISAKLPRCWKWGGLYTF